MKVLCIGDVHFKDISAVPHFKRLDETGNPIELTRAIKSLKWVESLIEDTKPDLIVQLGDVFHQIGQVNSNVLIEASRSFKSLHNVCKSIHSELFIIGGNHDIYSKGKYTTEILSCDYHFSKPEEVADFHFIPYLDPEYSVWEEISNSNSKYIFTHTQVKGVRYSKMRKSDEGLDLSIVKNNIVSGHIHIPQKIQNVYYTGSLYQNNPTEQPIDIPFGVTMLDTDTDSYTQYENSAVTKLATFYIETITDIPTKLTDNLDKYRDDYIIKLVSSDREVIDFFDKNMLNYYVVPFKKDTDVEIVEYVKDTQFKTIPQIISEYVNKKYAHISEDIEKLMKE